MEIKDSDKGIGNFNYQPDRQNASSSRSRNARRSSTDEMIDVSDSESGGAILASPKRSNSFEEQDTQTNSSSRSRNSKRISKGNVRSKSAAETSERNRYVLIHDHVISDQIKQLGLTAQVDRKPNKFNSYWLKTFKTKESKRQLIENSKVKDVSIVQTSSSIETGDQSENDGCTVIYNSHGLKENIFHRNSDGLIVNPAGKIAVASTKTESLVHTVDFRPAVLECHCNHDDKTEDECFEDTKNRLKQNDSDYVEELTVDVRKYFPSHADHFFRSKDDLCKDLSCIACLFESYKVLQRSSSADCICQLRQDITLFGDSPDSSETQQTEHGVNEKQTSDVCDGQWTPLKSSLDQHQKETGGGLIKSDKEFSKDYSDSEDSEQGFEMLNTLEKSQFGWMTTTKIQVSKRESNIFVPASF